MARQKQTKIAAAAQEVVMPNSDHVARTDAQSWDRKYRRLRSWFELEHARQEVNRYQQALDCDYRDGKQWTNEEARIVRSRGQNPVVYNEIHPTIEWLAGTERRMRRDFKVMARYNSTKEAGQDAEIKTQFLKYLDDVNRSPFTRSESVDDQLTAGVGWIEAGISQDPEDEQIYLRHVPWRNMLHDSLGSADMRENRYHFRFGEFDLDIANAYFPGKTVELERASDAYGLTGLADLDDTDWNGTWPTSRVIGDTEMPARWISSTAEHDILNTRRRVGLIECWYREPTNERTGEGAGSTDRVRMTMRVAIFTRYDMLLDLPSPYKHNRFPFIPIWCYRFKRDGLPYGVVRNARGPQDSLNERMSKAQFLLSVNQLRMEKSAIDAEGMDEDELRDGTLRTIVGLPR